MHIGYVENHKPSIWRTYNLSTKVAQHFSCPFNKLSDCSACTLGALYVFVAQIIFSRKELEHMGAMRRAECGRIPVADLELGPVRMLIVVFSHAKSHEKIVWSTIRVKFDLHLCGHVIHRSLLFNHLWFFPAGGTPRLTRLRASKSSICQQIIITMSR